MEVLYSRNQKAEKMHTSYSHSFQFAGLFWLSVLSLCHLGDLLSNISEEIKTLEQRG